MQASLIQDFPKLDSSEKTSHSKHSNQPDNEDSFRDKLDEELMQKSGPHPMRKDMETQDLLSNHWAGTVPMTPGQNPEPSSKEPSSHSVGTSENRGKPDANDSKIEHHAPGETGEQIDSKQLPKTGDAKENKGVEKSSEGKNVLPDNQDSKESAKNAVRPSQPPKGPLTYGNVKHADTMLVGAGSATSSSVQSIPLHPGTSHASGVNRSTTELNQDGSGMKSSLSPNTMRQEITIKNETLQSEQRGLAPAGIQRIAHADSSSFNSAFSGSGSNENNMFSGRDASPVQVLTDVKNSFNIPSASSSMVDSIRKMQSMIQEQVVVLRNLPNQSMQVMIRPDANLALFLTLQQGESDVFVSARMDQATGGQIKPHWSELQKELEQHGIRLGDPEMESDNGTAFSNRNGNDHFKKESPDQTPWDDHRSSQNRPDKNIEVNPERNSNLTNPQGTLVSWA